MDTNPVPPITPPTPEPVHEVTPDFVTQPVSPLIPKKGLSGGIIALIIASAVIFLGALVGGGILIAQAVGKNLTTASTTTPSTTAENIVGSKVTLTGTTVDAACYTFETPTGFILNPSATDCQAQVRLSAGLSTGASVTQLSVKAQSGKNDLDYFFTTMQNSLGQSGLKISESKKVTVAGIESGLVTYVDANTINQSIYFVPDTSGKFTAGSKPVTSFLINGPTSSMLQTVIDSFTIK